MVKTASLVRRLEQAAPGFLRYVESDGNLFPTDNVHGVFAACSHFVREQPVSRQSWQALAGLMNEIVGAEDEELDNPACTCFLENLANLHHPLGAFLRDGALAYWDHWCGGV